MAIEPKTKGDQEKLGTAIQKLAEEDPTFQVQQDEETGQTIIAGMGELHLDILVDRMRREFKVEANVGKPQVAYRETIRRAVAEVRLHPQEADRWFGPVREGADDLRAAGLRGRRDVRVREQGHRWPYPAGVHPERRPRHPGRHAVSACSPGYPLVGIKATLLDGAYHDVDSSEMAFKIAGSMVLKEAVRKADPVLLEPVMAVEVRTPEDYMGDVIGDLNSRRGQIQSMEDASGARSSGPSCRCRRCSATLATCGRKTQGRANYTMQFDSYAEVPGTSRRRSSRRPGASRPARSR